MTWWQAAILGLVQGLAEFLPISSSGHLVLGQYLLGLEGADDVTFEVFAHFGTVLSILTVYWKRILGILGSFFGAVGEAASGTGNPAVATRYREDEHFRFGLFILITMVPTGLIYLLFNDRIEDAFAVPRVTCWMLLVTGALLLLTLLRRNPEGPLSALKSFVIGAAQGAAMLPGISRSGATICTALYQGVENRKAADFSFLMSVPAILGATLVSALEVWEQGNGMDFLPLLVGTGVAYVSGVIAIKAMIGIVSRGNLHYFAFYCFAVGIIGLIFI